MLVKALYAFSEAAAFPMPREHPRGDFPFRVEKEAPLSSPSSGTAGAAGGGR
jgi:hypothetical protein